MRDSFAFIIHPLTYNDYLRKFKFLGRMPKNIVYKITKHLPPFKVSKITGLYNSNGAVDGWLIALPLTTEQMHTMPEKEVINRILMAGHLADKLGAKIVGLGAHTSVIGDAGETISDKLDIAVTTGNTYTVAIALEAIEYACKLMNRNLKTTTLAVIGATGSIGTVCSQYFADKTEKLVLVGRDTSKLNKLQQDLKSDDSHIVTTTMIHKAVSLSDIIITVTSSTLPIINPAFIKKGALLCDVARPRDVAKVVMEKRHDVLVIDGGLVQLPQTVNFNFNFGLPPGLAYACMAETMLLALSSCYGNFSLGRSLKKNNVSTIQDMAAKHGFYLAGLRSFDETVPLERIRRLKQKLV